MRNRRILLPLLAAWGAGEIAVAGVATNHVVESAARHAADLGFSVVVLEERTPGRAKKYPPPNGEM